MYVLTGGAGFIGSAFLAKLNQEGIRDILVVDALESSDKWKNLNGKVFSDYLDREEFLELVQCDSLPSNLKGIIHLGACSSTTERDVDYLIYNNYKYTVALAEYCHKNSVQFIYASSGATYGDGNFGYSDKTSPQKLLPLNPYGFSKNLVDIYLEKNKLAESSVGIKFFNVFGPNEYHKEDMQSVVVKAYKQIKATGKVKLFKSYRHEFKDGEQKRDFIYVKDCCDVMWWFLQNPKVNGLFNLGTGKARSWNDLVTSIFSALSLPVQIEYIEMPEDLKNQYQYFTEAEMSKLVKAGYEKPFLKLEESVKDYVLNYLEESFGYL